MIVGIDTGTTGAIAVLTDDGKYVNVFDMPVNITEYKARYKGEMVNRKRRSVNAEEVYLILKQLCDSHDVNRVVLELINSMGNDAAYASMQMGKSYGIVEGCLSALPVEVTKVLPRTWKGSMDLKGGDKKSALVRARKLWPDAPLHLEKHHNRAEALLLASFSA